MEPVRNLLPENLRQAMERKLGREETLRLLWPAAVGPQLAAQIELRQLRGSLLVVSIPDREWRGPLLSLERMILDAVNRFSGTSPITAIEFVSDPRAAMTSPAPVTNCAGNAERRPGEASAGIPMGGPGGIPGATPGSMPSGIEDERLREAFARSAQKYFSRQDPARRG